MAATHAFDLCLSFPQWQGSARHENLLRGGRAAAETCKAFAPRFETVPLVGETPQEHGVNNWRSIITQLRAAKSILASRQPRRVLTAGGDCSVDVAVIDYLSGVYPDLSVLWIDAHLDANTPETTPSGSFHGMPVAALLGEAPEPVKGELHNALSSDRFFYWGVRVGDEGEWRFKSSRDLRILDSPSALSGKVHIHFDLDVLEPTEFPHLAYKEPGGRRFEEALALVAAVAQRAELVGLTITEFAPADEAGAQEGRLFIQRLCEAAAR